jgi:hypothetical protein
MHFVIILWFFPTFCWLRRLANVHCPLLGEILQFTEQGLDPLQDKIFSHLLDLMILNSSIVLCENDGTCCKGSNPCSVNYNVSPRRGQWTLANLLSQQNVGKNWSIMTTCIGLCILRYFVDYYKARLR